MAMTQEELINEINQLPPNKRKALADAILQGVQNETGAQPEELTEGPSGEKMAAFHRLRGMLKTGGEPPSDGALKDDYINYLAEKYS